MPKPTHCQCGAPLVQRPGPGRVLLCEPCRKERQRLRDLKPSRRVENRTGKHSRQCPCGAMFSVYAPSSPVTYCRPDCEAKRLRYGPHLEEVVPDACCIVRYRQCKWCEKWFVKAPGHDDGDYCCKTHRFVACGHAPVATPIAISECDECGELFVRREEQIGRFCSRRCGRRADKRHRKHLKRAGRRGDIAPITIRGVAERDGWKCAICGKAVPDRPYAYRKDDATIDHIIPVSEGGEHTWENVRLAHMRCNSERGAGGVAQLRLIA